MRGADAPAAARALARFLYEATRVLRGPTWCASSVPSPPALASVRWWCPSRPAAAQEASGAAPAAPPRPFRVPWAELLKRTFKVDVLVCDSCGGKRRVVACVFSPAVASRILEHLRLPSRPLPCARSQDSP